jgi:hypothetical protein
MTDPGTTGREGERSIAKLSSLFPDRAAVVPAPSEG